MPLSQETVLIIGAAGGTSLLALLVVALWRWASLQQRLQAGEQRIEQLTSEQQSLAESRHELQTELLHSQAEHRARTVELQQVRTRLDEKLRELGGVRDELADLSSRFNTLANEHTELQTRQAEREDRHKEQIELLNEARENLKREFENLAHRIFEDKGKSFTSTNRESLEALLKPFREQISGFQSRIIEVHT